MRCYKIIVHVMFRKNSETAKIEKYLTKKELKLEIFNFCSTDTFIWIEHLSG